MIETVRLSICLRGLRRHGRRGLSLAGRDLSEGVVPTGVVSLGRNHRRIDAPRGPLSALPSHPLAVGVEKNIRRDDGGFAAVEDVDLD